MALKIGLNFAIFVRFAMPQAEWRAPTEAPMAIDVRETGPG